MNRRLIPLAGALAALQILVACHTGPTPRFQFGIVSDPWHVDDWARAVGAKPSFVMEFEPWSRLRTLDSHFAEARAKGLKAFMVTWEPWKPAGDARLAVQATPQPAYSNLAIARGKWDRYIRTFADSVRRSGLTVYIRFAHEMNGYWYPWSWNEAEYVEAWRHIHDLFRQEGAANARFVWSVNSSLFQNDATWLTVCRRFWPGPAYVDLVGMTLINFGGTKAHPVQMYVSRLELLHMAFAKPVFVTELKTAYEGRVRWLTDLRDWLAFTPSWMAGLTLSQGGPSYGQEQLGPIVGNVQWQLTDDPASRPIVKSIAQLAAGG